MHQFTTISALRDVPNGGIQQSVVDAWIRDFQAFSGREKEDFDLTPLQAQVANHPEAFGRRESDQMMRGPNLVITGPASVGKILCAEILMASHLVCPIHIRCRCVRQD